MPRHSAYNEALAQDEVLAEIVAARDDHEPPPAPSRRVSEYTPVVEVLTDVLDRLGELIQAVVATRAGGRQVILPRAPRPVTAFERARRRRREQRHDSLVSRLLPHRDQPP